MTTQISIQSQLMKNHVAGKRLPAQRHLAVVRSSAGTPLLFALNTAGQLTVTVESSTSTSGWDQIDLGAQVPNVRSDGIATFAVSQGSDGSIWIAIAPASASGAREVYVSTNVAAAGSDIDWASFGSKLVKRMLPSAVKVDLLALGVAVSGYRMPLLVVTGTDANGQVQFFQVNPDPEDASWTSQPIIMPQNATACLGAIPGYLNAKGLGVYALCSVGVRAALTFTPLPQFYHGHPVTAPALDLGTPKGATLSALAAAVRKDGQTELYVSPTIGIDRFR